MARISFLFAVLFAISSNAFGGTISGDENSEPQVFYIDNANDLLEFSKLLKQGNGCITPAVVRNDIDCTGLTIEPMGTYWGPYMATFDGGGHTLKNLHISSDEYPVGLFRYLGGDGVIKNLTLDETCSIVGTGSLNGSSVAGFVGQARVPNDDAKTVTIDGCCNKASVTGRFHTAGIIGGNNEKAILVIKNCSNMGVITGDYKSGAIGSNLIGKVSITNCWNSGTVIERESQDNIDFCDFDEEADVTLEDNYSVNATQTGIVSFNPADVASGRLCYLMNGSQSGSVSKGWYQHIYDESNTYPTRIINEDHKIYAHQNHYCNQTEADNFEVYDNSQDQPDPIHVYDSKGFCHTISGGTHYQKPAIENNICKIANAGNLYWYAEQYNAGEIGNSAELTNDIIDNDALYVNGKLRSDLSNARVWTPIGTPRHPFNNEKSFNGNNHTISGLWIPKDIMSPKYSGLFAWACDHVSITNLGIIDSYFYGQDCAGAFVAAGFNPDDPEDYLGPILHNCYSTGEVHSQGNSGGIAGLLYHGNQQNYMNHVTHCYSTCKVSSSYYESNAGSLFGFLADNDIQTSYTGQLKHCYYQLGKNTGCKANDGNDYGTPKSALAFQLGEVCQLLNGDDELWTQQLGVDASPKFGTKKISYKRNVSSEWGTVIVPYTLTSTDDIQYYTASYLDNEHNLHLKAIETVAPNTPCFFNVEEGTESVDFGYANAITLPDDKLVNTKVKSQSIKVIGTYNNLQVEGGGQNYFMARNMLWWGEETFNVPAFHGYIELIDASSAKSLSIIVDDEKTGISNINNEKATMNCGKCLENGNIVIRKNGKKYSVSGQTLM